MKAGLLLLVLVSIPSWALGTKASLQQQLDAFLYGASVNSVTEHDIFWAQDLVYTSSTGTRFDKATLMHGVRQSGPIAKEDITASYHAEDVRIRLLGEVALLDFTLVATMKADNTKQYYLNSGTFVWRDNRWQAVNWHATVKAP